MHKFHNISPDRADGIQTVAIIAAGCPMAESSARIPDLTIMLCSYDFHGLGTSYVCKMSEALYECVVKARLNSARCDQDPDGHRSDMCRGARIFVSSPPVK